MTDITYRRGLPQNRLDQAAELYEAAFGQKLSCAMPDRGDRIALIRQGFDPRFAIAAIDGDRLVGLAGFHTVDGHLSSRMTSRAIMARLGTWRGLRACLLLSLYERHPAAGELLMDGIAVSADCRGMGIGTALLRQIVTVAADEGCKSVRLDVIDSNRDARRLYERFGFEPVKERSYRPLTAILGFGGSATMEYRLEH